MGKLFTPFKAIAGIAAPKQWKNLVLGTDSSPSPTPAPAPVAAKPAPVAPLPPGAPVVDTIGTFTDPAEDRRRKAWAAQRQQLGTILSGSGSTREFV